MKRALLCLCLMFAQLAQAQKSPTNKESDSTTTSKADKKLIDLESGYLTIGPIDLDLKRLMKYNNFEGFKFGMGAITNNAFSDRYQLDGFVQYGIKDKRFKYGGGGYARLNKDTNTWLGLSYSRNLIETGSYEFLSDSRQFQFFEPRLINMITFHWEERYSVSLSHDLSSKLQANLRVSKAAIAPTYQYTYALEDERISSYDLVEASVSAQWFPFGSFSDGKEGQALFKSRFPNFTLQYTKGYDDRFAGDLDYHKLEGRVVHHLNRQRSITELLLNFGLATGDLPLQQLYHLSPNDPDNDDFWKRFSVAGRNGFETMFFNEFFSDRFASLQARHTFKRTKIFNGLAPNISLVSRFAIGNTNDVARHDGLPFSTLEEGYYESGLELNRMFQDTFSSRFLQGFGLSFMYRYGPYQLEDPSDNISFKFTYYYNLGI